jgi:hypothetical protein
MGSGSFVVRGGSWKLAMKLLGARTPRKIRTRFQEHKHTSLTFTVVTFYELRFYGVLGSWFRKFDVLARRSTARFMARKVGD